MHLGYLKNELKLSINIPKVIREIHNVLIEKQLWDGLERKSRFRRLAENIWWYIKNKEACIYYNSYGFDIKNFRDKKDYLPYRKFRIERYFEDYPKSLYDNKLLILRNKIIFSLFFGDVLGTNLVVQNIALINTDGSVFDFTTKQIISLSSFFKERREQYFVKKIDGECGEGCYLLHPNSDFSVFSDQTKGSCYLIQKRVKQHNEVDQINPSCINTIRIITIVGRKTKKPYVFAHYMRVGCNSINDNRATGGVGVGISDGGTMFKYGVGHHKIETKHPVTGHVYDGTVIPYWDTIKELVVKAHSFLLDVPTIGWDVAITPNGPILIEGNDNWEISGAQDTVGGLKKKWYEFHEK